MPRAIPSPIATKRKRAAALQVSEPSRKEAPNGTNGHSIGDLAEQIIDLKRLYSRMDEAHGGAEHDIERLRVEKPNDADRRCDILHMATRFEIASKVAYARSRVLEDLTLLTEPKTADETLTLALLLRDRFESFANEHPERKEIEVENEIDRLSRALNAVIRGLALGAKAHSPLLDYYMGGEDLTPWDALRERASAEAIPFVEDDPPVGAAVLVNGEAAQ